MCVLSIKVPIRKKSGNLFNDPRIQADMEKNVTLCQWVSQKNLQQRGIFVKAFFLLYGHVNSKNWMFCGNKYFHRVIRRCQYSKEFTVGVAISNKFHHDQKIPDSSALAVNSRNVRTLMRRYTRPISPRNGSVKYEYLYVCMYVCLQGQKKST